MIWPVGDLEGQEPRGSAGGGAPESRLRPGGSFVAPGTCRRASALGRIDRASAVAVGTDRVSVRGGPRA